MGKNHNNDDVMIKWKTKGTKRRWREKKMKKLREMGSDVKRNMCRYLDSILMKKNIQVELYIYLALNDRLAFLNHKNIYNIVTMHHEKVFLSFLRSNTARCVYKNTHSQYIFSHISDELYYPFANRRNFET